MCHECVVEWTEFSCLVSLLPPWNRKIWWILGKEPRSTASDPKVEWMFNSMENRIYNMFLYHDIVHGLWIAMTKMYAHAHCDSRIFELYRDISHASQDAFGLSLADFFGYLQTRWEELAQCEPLSDFPTDAAIESKRLDHRHTYQFLMGLKPEFEALQAQIFNTSSMPSLYEAFATVHGDDRRCRLLPLISSPELSPPVPDQMVFAASSGSRPGNKDRGKWAPRTGVIAEVAPALSILDYSQLQSQIAQLQSHLGLGPASSATISSASPTATLATDIPTAFHVKSDNPTWILDSGASNHMTGELSILSSPVTPVTQSIHIADGSSIKISSQGTPSLPGPVEETPPEDIPLLSRPALILEPPPVSSPSLTTDPFPYVPRCPPSNVPRRPRSHVPPPDSTPDSGTSPLPLASDIAPPRVFQFPISEVMTIEEDSIEQAAAARRERLKALKVAQELLSTPDEDSVQNEDKTEEADGTNEDRDLNMKFRNYLPHDKQLQEGKLAPPVLPKFEDPIAVAPPPSEKIEDPFVNIAPKKPNWDLRRDIQKKLDKLERRTHKAIFQLMEEQEKQNQTSSEENGGFAVEDENENPSN
ncbi:hypothetical protein HHK36_014505 [Tetracentron sinense]|uniref:Retrovirus-related Pol polyprotein from transposon TNT 1-94-like beta-barrel domain-containing protein n=1 Tax=Tetracentron sinense TaxID=13715 RepID=A0A834Z313_TETSI|nr:hypothetical protein HHK36_014505 [Tetracentron sinense]